MTYVCVCAQSLTTFRGLLLQGQAVGPLPLEEAGDVEWYTALRNEEREGKD